MRTQEEQAEFLRGCLEQAAFEYAQAFNAGFCSWEERGEKEMLIEKAMAFCGYSFSYSDMKWHGFEREE